MLLNNDELLNVTLTQYDTIFDAALSSQLYHEVIWLTCNKYIAIEYVVFQYLIQQYKCQMDYSCKCYFPVHLFIMPPSRDIYSYPWEFSMYPCFRLSVLPCIYNSIIRHGFRTITGEPLKVGLWYYTYLWRAIRVCLGLLMVDLGQFVKVTENILNVPVALSHTAKCKSLYICYRTFAAWGSHQSHYASLPAPHFPS